MNTERTKFRKAFCDLGERQLREITDAEVSRIMQTPSKLRKSTVSYQEATRRERSFENTSQSESEVEETNSLRQRNKIKRPARFLSPLSDTASKIPRCLRRNSIQIEDITLPQLEFIEGINSTSASPESELEYIVKEEEEETKPTPMVEIDMSNSLTHCLLQEEPCTCDQSQQMTRIEAKLNIIIERLKYLERGFAVHQTVQETNLLPELPMQTDQDFDNFERQLSQTNVYTQMVQYIKGIGGTDIKSAVRRCLEKLFTNKLAKGYSWKGLQNNRQLKGKLLMKVLKDGIRYNIPCTECDIETALKDWFRYASLRFKREAGET